MLNQKMIKNLMKQAHKMTKEIINECHIIGSRPITCTYAEQFGICLKILVEEAKQIRSYLIKIDEGRKEYQKAKDKDYIDHTNLTEYVVNMSTIPDLKSQLKKEVEAFKKELSQKYIRNTGEGKSFIEKNIQYRLNKIRELKKEFPALNTHYKLDNYLGSFEDCITRLTLTLYKNTEDGLKWFGEDIERLKRWGYKEYKLDTTY